MAWKCKYYWTTCWSGVIAGGVGSKSKDGYGCELNKPINTKERVTVL